MWFALHELLYAVVYNVWFQYVLHYCKHSAYSGVHNTHAWIPTVLHYYRFTNGLLLAVLVSDSASDSSILLQYWLL